MLLKNQHPLNKHITVAVMGIPNVGKSSLINYLLGTNLSAVTPLPQTTRNKFRCIFTVDRTEVVLVDTPGLHRSNREFNKRLNQQARDGCDGADLTLFLVDLTRPVLAQLQQFEELFKTFATKRKMLWLVFTKSDCIDRAEELPLEKVLAKAQELFASVGKYFVVSCKTQSNMNILTGAILDAALPGAHLYPGGEISDKSERFFVCEYIREEAFKLLREEIPYEIAVVIDQYKEISQKESIRRHIVASILVNRLGQRGIVVGQGGAIVRQIGINSRRKIEAMVGAQINLNLHVKVVPSWFKKNAILEALELPRAINSTRVWRSADQRGSQWGRK